MSNTFSMTMRVKFPALPTDSNIPFNLLDIRNQATGVSLVRLWVTSLGNLRVEYNGVIDSQEGAPLLAAFNTEYTTIGVHYIAGTIQTSSNYNNYSTGTVTATASMVDTTGQIYEVWLSSPFDPTVGGVFDWFTMRGNIFYFVFVLQIICH